MRKLNFILAEELRVENSDMDIDAFLSGFINQNPVPNPTSSLPTIDALSLEAMQPAPLAPTDVSMTESNPKLTTTSISTSVTLNSDDEPLSSLMSLQRLQPPTPIQKRRRRNPTE